MLKILAMLLLLNLSCIATNQTKQPIEQASQTKQTEQVDSGDVSIDKLNGAINKLQTETQNLLQQKSDLENKVMGAINILKNDNRTISNDSWITRLLIIGLFIWQISKSAFRFLSQRYSNKKAIKRIRRRPKYVN